MCGTAGYIGLKPAQAIIHDMLLAQLYRGYDSIGMLVFAEPIIKVAGKADTITDRFIQSLNPQSGGKSGIGHTRWATHGPPSVENAHPHMGPSGKLSIVHNGTIENHADLRRRLTANGSSFSPEGTDSEVVAHLIESYYKGDLHDAVTTALREVRGTYGIVAMHSDHPDELVVACLGSPIVIGIGEDGHYVAADESALVAHTRRIFPLEDGESAILRTECFTPYRADGETVDRAEQVAEGNVEMIQKGGHPHFTLKEINEAPAVLTNTTRGRLLLDDGMVKLGGVERVQEKLLARTNNLALVGCGSAHFASRVGAWMFREHAGVEAQCYLGSEFRHQRLFNPEERAMITVSQSGGTLDTRMGVQHAKANGMLTLGIINKVGSQIARETDAGIYNQAGPEIAVASTKAVLSQMAAFAMLTVFLGRKNGTMSRDEGAEIVRGLADLPDHLSTVLSQAEHIKSIAGLYGHYDSMMFIGQGSHAPMAHEGALKLREIGLKNTLGVEAGELKHGSIALLHEGYPVFALAPQGHDEIYELVMTNLSQIRARNAPIVAVATEGDGNIADVAQDVIYVPQVHPVLQPILSIVPWMLMSYYIGVNCGVNVDRPPNLAKSVTTG